MNGYLVVTQNAIEDVKCPSESQDTTTRAGSSGTPAIQLPPDRDEQTRSGARGRTVIGVTEHTHTHADGSVHGGTHEACALAHGDVPADIGTRTLVAVFANPVSSYLMHFARDAGFRTVLVEPDPANVTDEVAANADGVATTVDPSFADGHADIVFCDHHRPELGDVMTDALAYPARWIGVMGNARDAGPHVEMLRDRGVPEDLIATVHRPIGLNIGSKTPAEIAISTLAGLIADRNDRPGGFAFPKPAAAS